MGGGTSKRSQPANFARESNPASQRVKILPKDFIQHKRLFTNQTRKSIHNRATLTQTFLKKQQCNQQRRPRGAKRRKKRTLKQNQLRAKKTTVQPEKVTEGSKEKEETLKQNQSRAKKTAVQPPKVIERGKEEWTLKTNPKETTVQPKQRRPSRPRERETHIRTTKDRDGRSHQRLYRYSQKLPNDVGRKGACAENETV